MNRNFWNLFVLYFVHFSNYLFPLLLLPYLSRILGPSEWGKVVLATSLGQYIFIFVEYGFTFSGSREIAQKKNDPMALKQFFWSVVWGKLVLAFFCLIFGILIFVFTGNRIPVKFVLPAFFWGVVQGMNVVWFFQGLEKMYLPAIAEFFSKTVNFIGILLLVREPMDSWCVLVINAVAALFSLGLAGGAAVRIVGWQRPIWRNIYDSIIQGVNVFFFQVTCNLYTLINPLLVGYLIGTDSVGFFAGPEKIIKGFMSLITPLASVLYPKFSHFIRQAPMRAVRLARQCFAFYSILAFAMGVGIFFSAEKLVFWILGSKFSPSVDLLKILSVLPMATVLNHYLTIQWMFPLQLDRFINYAVATSGIFHLVLAFILVPLYGVHGMCITLLCSEFFTLIIVWVYLYRNKLDPIQVTVEQLQRLTKTYGHS